MKRLLWLLSFFLTIGSFTGVTSIFFEPTSYSRQLLLPNTGSHQPGIPPAQTSSQAGASGEVPTNPSEYDKPLVTPPVYQSGNSCTPGYLGSVDSNDQGSIVSGNDFQRTYRCFSEVSPELSKPAFSGSPGQQAGRVPEQPFFVPNGGVNGIPGIGDSLHSVPRARTDQGEATDAGVGGMGTSSAAMGSGVVANTGG